MPPSHSDSEAVTEDRVAGYPILENLSSEPGIVEVKLTASKKRNSLKVGVESDVYAYNGRVPGPLLKASEGDSVIIHFKNDLPEETTRFTCTAFSSR